jgi:hypothetical protein
MNILFQPGYDKIYFLSGKLYNPFLYRFDNRRYAGRGRIFFKTATAAMNYAQRWAERASRFLAAKEKSHVN